ncbi:hypothetical protein, partial [uncultured Roseibium sp.]|uniref:hypothetical protein n=1 Tax=uncultured Roseibium sp. TaxID=1936171 RepID=UPI0026133FF5
DELVTVLQGAKLRLEEQGVPLTSLSAMLHGAGAKAPEALDELVTVLQGARPRLEELKGLSVSPASLSAMLHGAGAKAPAALKKLMKVLKEASPSLNKLKEQGVPLTSLSSMLSGAGAQAPEALKKLLTVLDKPLDDLSAVVGKDKPVEFQNISYLLTNAGKDAPQALAKMFQVLQTHATLIPQVIGKESPFAKLSSLVKVSDRPNSVLKVPERFDLALRSDRIRTLLLENSGEHQHPVDPVDIQQICQELTQPDQGIGPFHMDNLTSDGGWSIEEILDLLAGNHEIGLGDEERSQINPADGFDEEDLDIGRYLQDNPNTPP